MASSSSTRAIEIPNHYTSEDQHNPGRRRRHDRLTQTRTMSDNSVLSTPSPLGSDMVSPWSSNGPANGPVLSRRLQAIPSPSTTNNASNEMHLPDTPTNSSSTPNSYTTSTSHRQSRDKRKATTTSTSSPPPSHTMPSLFPEPVSSPLSPSMLSSNSYKSINLNSHYDDPDEPPRLITYTKHGQGFTWNDELFLPSYMLNRYGYNGRGRKKQYDSDFGDEEHCPVTEIFITDEEAQAMMP